MMSGQAEREGTVLRSGMSNNPIGEQCQHLLKIGSLRKPVVSAWKNFQAFRAREGVEQSLALVERHKFIVIALDDQGWNGEASRGLIGDPVEAILIEGVIEWKAGRATVKVWDRIGLFPLLQSFFSKLKTKFLREVDHGTLECQAGEGRDGRRIRNVCGCPVGSSEERDETAEAGSDEGQTTISAVVHVA